MQFMKLHRRKNHFDAREWLFRSEYVLFMKQNPVKINWDPWKFYFWCVKLSIKGRKFKVIDDSKSSRWFIQSTWKMAENKRFIVLADYRYLMYSMNISNKNLIQLKVCPFPQWMFLVLVVFLFLGIVFLVLWCCYDYDFDLRKMWPLNLILGPFQTVSIHLAMVAKKDLVVRLMKELQLLINQSKLNKKPISLFIIIIITIQTEDVNHLLKHFLSTIKRKIQTRDLVQLFSN